ncbi:hypothetical protein F0562_010266 [Nyssa sinensis]|uniref:Late embryogenesis abundant protein LEA-2 subgroup domain-containing protein n=1 Tax=Nyssa sinensis TaxID=561372 RepID=A0A5J4ZYD6_9ASTE|nr:hypothetical protein F0562_010266 [Nyssa sinensis]
MKIISSSCILIILLFFVSGVVGEVKAAPYSYRCENPSNRCYGRTITCPDECPTGSSEDPKVKVCYINCDSPICRPECKHRRPNCDSFGSACYDPRFIGGDGIVFYFHGKSNEHFSLVSDRNFQINARFIGHRPAGRTRDFTWIQALGFLFNSHTFSLEATKVATWDDNIDHLKFSYNGKEVIVPVGPLAVWNSPEKNVKIERISSKNSVVVSIPEVAEIAVNVVPVTKEDDRIHKYKIPSHDCFAHLEVQFRFYGLSAKVEGVLGRTYQPDFENPAKPGVAMPVVGGEDKYRTTSLLSPDCKTCLYSPTKVPDQESPLIVEYGTLDCTDRKPNCDGNGAACFDPHFIGGDGIVFYFQGKRNEHLGLFSDHNLHINSRFIGLRPAGRTRDFTWIQALGILFGSHTFSLEATKAATWDDKIDHLSFSYDGEELMLPEGPLSTWKSSETKMKIERISSKNSVVVSLPNVVEISVNVVPITKEDDRIHNYQIASDDCFAHLEVQFRFFGLSPGVEGVLGRTYQPDIENPAKPGEAMPVVGGEDKYRTTSLLSEDCKACIFTPNNVTTKESSVIMEYGMLDCTGGFSRGNGIVCKK